MIPLTFKIKSLGWSLNSLGQGGVNIINLKALTFKMNQQLIIYHQQNVLLQVLSACGGQ